MEKAMKRMIGLMPALILLGACGEKPQPDSGVTAEEAAALNETENMLDMPSGDDIAAEAGNSGDLLVTGEEATNTN
jgi:hypothetical protein